MDFVLGSMVQPVQLERHGAGNTGLAGARDPRNRDEYAVGFVDCLEFLCASSDGERPADQGSMESVLQTFSAKRST